jgi:hypothetical protein
MRENFAVEIRPALADVYLIPQVESAKRLLNVDVTQWPQDLSRNKQTEVICMKLDALFQEHNQANNPMQRDRVTAWWKSGTPIILLKIRTKVRLISRKVWALTSLSRPAETY